MAFTLLHRLPLNVKSFQCHIFFLFSIQVSEQQMMGDSDEEGVVKGSITLGGDWPKNVKKIRAVASSPSGSGGGGEDNSEERRLKKRARDGRSTVDGI